MVCHDCLKLSEMTQLDFYVYCCHSIQKFMVNWLTNWILTLHSSTMSIFCCKEKLLMWTLKSSIYSYLTLATASPAFLNTMMCLEVIFLYIKLVQLEFSWIRYIKYTLYYNFMHMAYLLVQSRILNNKQGAGSHEPWIKSWSCSRLQNIWVYILDKSTSQPASCSSCMVYLYQTQGKRLYCINNLGNILRDFILDLLGRY